MIDARLVSRAVPNEHAARAAISADGARIVIGRSNGRIAIYEGTQLRFFRELSAGDGVAAVAISADGSTVAIGSRTGQILLWDLSRDDIWEHLVPATGEITLALANDGRRCIATYRGGVHVRDDSGSMVQMHYEPDKTSTCIEIADRGVRRSIAFAGVCERVQITDHTAARLEIQVDEPWSHQVEEWTFEGERVSRTVLVGMEGLPSPPRVTAGKALSTPTDTGDVFVRTGDGVEGVASTVDLARSPRVLASPVFAQGDIETAANGVVTITVETPWMRTKHRHTLKCTAIDLAVDARFPHVQFFEQGAGTRHMLLDYLALPDGEFLTRNEHGWFASKLAFDAGFVCVNGRAFSSYEAAVAVLGPPDPRVLAAFNHAVTDAKKQAASRKMSAHKPKKTRP